MKNRIKYLIHRFASWLWLKTYEPTATEKRLVAIAKGLKFNDPYDIIEKPSPNH